MYALAFGATVWALPVGPESLEVSYPARTAVAQTLTSAYLEHFGPGVGAVVLSGTTGWGVARNGSALGLAWLNRLIALYNAYLREAAAASDPSTIRMTFADATMGQAFLVVPDPSGLRVQGHKASPLLRRFTLSMIILQVLSGGQAANEITLGKLASDLSSSEGANYEAEARSALELGAFSDPPLRYEVQPGDTYEAIALQFKVAPRVLADANAVRYPGRLLPGYVLEIPQ